LCPPGSLYSLSQLGAVGGIKQGLKLGRELLYYPLSFGFQLRGVASLAPRLKIGGNRAGLRVGGGRDGAAVR